MVSGWIWLLVSIISFIWVTYDVLVKQEMENKMKVLWIVLTFFTGIIGAGIYYYMNKYKK